MTKLKKAPFFFHFYLILGQFLSFKLKNYQKLTMPHPEI